MILAFVASILLSILILLWFNIYRIPLIFYIIFLPFATALLARYLVRLREKHGWWTWRGRILAAAWLIFLFGDIPVKLALLGYHCARYAEAWIDPSLNLERIRLETQARGCTTDCILQIWRDPKASVILTVYKADHFNFVYGPGRYEFFRAGAGDEACVEDWELVVSRAKRAGPNLHDGDPGRSYCLARRTLSDRVDSSLADLTSGWERHRYLVDWWPIRVSEFRADILNRSTSQPVLRLRVFRAELPWWISVRLSCPVSSNVDTAREFLRLIG